MLEHVAASIAPAVLTPMRVGASENWIEKCVTCEKYWVDGIDRRQLKNFARAQSRRAAFETLSPAERKELASELAATTADVYQPALSPFQVVLAALGVPMLERVEGNRLPWMTWCLSALLVLTYVVGKISPETFGPLELAWSDGESALRLLTANFIHFDFIHLFGNTVFLLAFGDALEQRLRRRWLVLAFLLFGPMTVAVQSLVTSPGIPIGGASGAVMVVMGACVVLQPKARIIIFLLMRTPLRIRMSAFGALEILYQTVMALIDVPGVGWFAHLTGLVMGVGLGVVTQRSSVGVKAVFEPHARVE